MITCSRMAHPRAILAVLLIALAAFAEAQSPAPSTPPPVPAAADRPATTDERLRRVRERKQSIERDVARLRGQEQSLLADVERLELEVRLRTEQLRETQLVLHRASEQMDATVRRVRELDAAVAQARPQLAARARALYKMGDLSYVRMLLSVEQPADMLRGYRFVSALARRDREKMAALRANLTTLAATRDDLQRKTRGDPRPPRRPRPRPPRPGSRPPEEVRAAHVHRGEEGDPRRLPSGARGGGGQARPAPVRPRGAPTSRCPSPSSRAPCPGRLAAACASRSRRHKHPRFETYTLHNGIEIEAPVDTPVQAVHDGTVAFADQFLGYGLMVIIDHGGKNHTLYAHLAETRVRTGQHVSAGDVVGTVGASGVDGPGLYFELRSQGKPQDPQEWLAREGTRSEPATTRSER